LILTTHTIAVLYSNIPLTHFSTFSLGEWRNQGALVVNAVEFDLCVVVAAPRVVVETARVLVDFLVLVRLIDLYVDVGVSGTTPVGVTPIVTFAAPLPCCPSIAMAI
jgi:hypothetical protein